MSLFALKTIFLFAFKKNMLIFVFENKKDNDIMIF